MIIKKITILDNRNNVSRAFKFNDKVNIIIGEDNGVGKSSLIKSLYYNLGVDNKNNMPDGWNYYDMIFKTEFIHDNERYYIVRYDDLFYVSENDGDYKVLEYKEYSVWLQDKLSVDVQLYLRSGENPERTTVYPGTMFVPFNIDQDTYWGPKPYNDAKSLNMYKSNSIADLFKILLGISDVEIQEKESLKNILKLKKDRSENKRDVLKEIVSEKEEKSIPMGIEKLKGIEKYFNILKDMNDTINKYVRERESLLHEANLINRQISNLKNIKKELEKDINEVNCECSQCGSVMTIELLSKKLELTNNLSEIAFEIDKLVKKKANKNEMIEEMQKNKVEVELKYQEYQNMINADINFKNIDEYINKQSSALAYNELHKNINDYVLAIESYKSQIKEITKELRELKNRVKERKDEIAKRYKELFNSIKINYLSQVIDFDLEDREFLSFKQISGSGTDQNMKSLIIYLVYSNLLAEYGYPKFPLGLDSIIFSEITTENLENMFKAVEEYFFNLNNQIFFTMVKDNCKYINIESYYTIILKDGERLLNDNHFEEHKKEFRFIKKEY
nr:MAG TPA: chromosome segregation ATPase [Caudoviricetes sp.]